MNTMTENKKYMLSETAVFHAPATVEDLAGFRKRHSTRRFCKPFLAVCRDLCCAVERQLGRSEEATLTKLAELFDLSQKEREAVAARLTLCRAAERQTRPALTGWHKALTTHEWQRRCWYVHDLFESGREDAAKSLLAAFLTILHTLEDQLTNVEKVALTHGDWMLTGVPDEDEENDGEEPSDDIVAAAAADIKQLLNQLLGAVEDPAVKFCREFTAELSTADISEIAIMITIGVSLYHGMRHDKALMAQLQTTGKATPELFKHLDSPIDILSSVGIMLNKHVIERNEYIENTMPDKSATGAMADGEKYARIILDAMEKVRCPEKNGVETGFYAFGIFMSIVQNLPPEKARRLFAKVPAPLEEHIPAAVATLILVAMHYQENAENDPEDF